MEVIKPNAGFRTKTIKVVFPPGRELLLWKTDSRTKQVQLVQFLIGTPELNICTWKLGRTRNGRRERRCGFTRQARPQPHFTVHAGALPEALVVEEVYRALCSSDNHTEPLQCECPESARDQGKTPVQLTCKKAAMATACWTMQSMALSFRRKTALCTAGDQVSIGRRSRRCRTEARYHTISHGRTVD